MKFYVIKSTGELEAAIVCIADGNNGIIFDFSTEESKIICIGYLMLILLETPFFPEQLIKSILIYIARRDFEIFFPERIVENYLIIVSNTIWKIFLEE